MHILLYGKKDCKLCADAEKKLQLMKVDYEKHDIELYSDYHEGWRDDNTIEIQALHCLINRKIPMVIVDGKPYEYTAAMRAIKEKKKLLGL